MSDGWCLAGEPAAGRPPWRPRRYHWGFGHSEEVAGGPHRGRTPMVQRKRHQRDLWGKGKPRMDGWFIVQPFATNSTNGWACTKQLQEQVLHGIIEWAWRQQCRYTGGTGQNDYLPRKQCLVERQEWRSESRKQVYGSSLCISMYDIYIYILYNTLALGVFNLECSTDRILYNWMIWIVASIFCPIRPEIILLHYM